MATAYRWRIWCSTDAKWEFCTTWDSDAPTECPVNAEHSVDVSRTSLIQHAGAAHPEAADGKPYMTPDIFAVGTRMQWVGAPDAVAGRGTGNRFLLRSEVNSLTGGSTSVAATRQITKTGAFTDALVGDTVYIAEGSDAGTYYIAVKDSPDMVTVHKNWPVGEQTVSFTTAKNVSREFSFNDWVELAGGICNVENAIIGDHVDMLVFAPGTPVTHNATDEGNCTLQDLVGTTPTPVTRWNSETTYDVGAIVVDSGGDTYMCKLGSTNNEPPNATYWDAWLPVSIGYYMLVPSDGAGTHNVDYDDAVPIPSQVRPTDSVSGSYEWTKPDEGAGAVSAGTPGGSPYVLLTFEKELAKYAMRKNLLGDECGTLIVPAIKPATILPHWTTKVTIHNCGHDTPQLNFSWSLLLARVKTT